MLIRGKNFGTKKFELFWKERASWDRDTERKVEKEEFIEKTGLYNLKEGIMR